MITGHRPHKLPGGYDLSSKDNKELYDQIKKIVLKTKEIHPDLILISGMALGVDTIFAKIEIPVHAYIPCLNQSSRWNIQAQQEYNYM